MKLFSKKSPQDLPKRRQNSTDARLVRPTSAELDSRYAFRRNRTFTGSLSPDVDSVDVQNRHFRSSRVQGHDLRSHRKQLVAILLAICAVVILLGYLIYNSIAVPVVKIGKTTNESYQQAYRPIIQDYLNNHPGERLRSTIDTENLAAYLQQNGAPEVQSVDSQLSFSGIGSSQLTLVMRQPAVVWKSGDRSYFVDETGVAFEKNYYQYPSVEVVDETGIATAGNRVLASDRFLGFIGKIIGRLKEQGITVTRVTLPAETTRQVRLSLEGIDYYVAFSVDRPAGEQAEDAARAIRHLQSKQINPQYIDVRVSGKAFYR